MANEWASQGDPWLKYIKYEDKLSHWQAKNMGISQAEGDFFWFIDSHCIMPTSTAEAIQFYMDNYIRLNGSLHMPLTYHILEPRQLMYKTVVDQHGGDYHYTFHTFSQKQYGGKVVEVPAMSTCGMMIHRSYLEQLGFWPTELGIYGGGENFMNFTMAVLGLKKWLWIGDSLCHHGDNRGYSWNSFDYQRNRAIATYMFGGSRLLELWISKKAKLRRGEGTRVYRSIIDTLSQHRLIIKNNQKCTIEEWVDSWLGNELMIGE